MSNLRKELVVISVAIPKKLKKHLNEIVELEGFDCRSDFLRKLLLCYLKYHIPAEDYAEIMDKIREMEVNKL